MEVRDGWRPQVSKIHDTEVITKPKMAYNILPFLWIEDGKPGKGHAVNWGQNVSVQFLARVGEPKGRVYQQTGKNAVRTKS